VPAGKYFEARKCSPVCSLGKSYFCKVDWNYVYLHTNLSRLRHVYVTPRSSIDFFPRLISGPFHNSGFRSNSSPKRLHQSPTIFLFFFTFLSLTLSAFSHPRSVTCMQFVISPAKGDQFCSLEPLPLLNCYFYVVYKTFHLGLCFK
jgi:hypothetical protein